MDNVQSRLGALAIESQSKSAPLSKSVLCATVSNRTEATQHLTKEALQKLNTATAATRLASGSTQPLLSDDQTLVPDRLNSSASSSTKMLISSNVSGSTVSSQATAVPPLTMAKLNASANKSRRLNLLLDKAVYNQCSTFKSLQSILRSLHEGREADRKGARKFFTSTMERNISQIKVLEERHASPGEFGYGSSWVQGKFTPLESNIMILLTYPPEEWPDWDDPSPTMNRLGEAGIWKIVKSGLVSFLHLHNHSHPTRTRPNQEHLIAIPEANCWPGDPPELVEELEKHVTDMVCARIQYGTSLPGFLLLPTGVYGRRWFDKHHKNGRFRNAIGYDYTLEKVTFPVCDSPRRELELLIFQPEDRTIEAKVAALLVNSPAFVAHHINDYNDCMGKALRLDAALEILRICLDLTEDPDLKQHFAKLVQQGLTGHRRNVSLPRNLVFVE